MEKIQAYKTKDGQIFGSQNEAKKHERELNLSDKINKWVEDYIEGGESGGAVYVEDVICALNDHGDELGIK